MLTENKIKDLSITEIQNLIKEKSALQSNLKSQLADLSLELLTLHQYNRKMQIDKFLAEGKLKIIKPRGLPRTIQEAKINLINRASPEIIKKVMGDMSKKERQEMLLALGIINS